MAKPEKKTNPPNQPTQANKTNGITKSYHQTLAQRRLRLRNNPGLSQKLTQMRLTIAPIVHVSTSLAAPDFPTTLLSLFLLTEPQLDALAHYYSQTLPSCHLTHAYPGTMNWSQPFLDMSDELPEDCKLDKLERLKIKMRMFARFVGMRGAETPGWEYERQIEILGNKVRWEVRREEEEEERRGKVFEGPRRLK
ncbi:hypothetical protein COCSADRAFT_282845 [Bipolaris sorokiniana ND90Pr]|uniref:Uncharacterized protein n=1 Tax=Cochliobolus sativus (strain ND90Pr / ATCC 201652) TaxID=665912 RepID=M2SX86_COCSN|nr:uncharacterized protein COCSADRAFT_282845 [Bipolaris sorokiniana ND90Pr]EMD66920.1 hypothetical protein COCSADRAFT_282845 [Bipolaris sorokiniana ND90Pr]